MRNALLPRTGPSAAMRVGALAAAIVAVGALAACGGEDRAAEPEPDPTSTTVTASPGEPAAPGTSAPARALAEWQRLPAIDSAGEELRIGDFVGRPVLVETFATWCSNCRRQLGDTQRAAELAGPAAVVVALSVETELGPEDMAAYASDNGFEAVRFAVMTPELLAAMNDAFGNTVLNPPATPKIPVAADGTPGSMKTGYESPDELLAALGLA